MENASLRPMQDFDCDFSTPTVNAMLYDCSTIGIIGSSSFHEANYREMRIGQLSSIIELLLVQKHVILVLILLLTCLDVFHKRFLVHHSLVVTIAYYANIPQPKLYETLVDEVHG